MLKRIRKKIRKKLTIGSSGQLKPDTENVKTNFTTEEEQQVSFYIYLLFLINLIN